MGSAAFGTVFKIGDTAVAELTDIGGPGISVDDIDVTAHDSADAHRVFVAGLIDSGEVSLEGNATSANLTALLTDLQGRTVKAMSIEYPDNVTLSFDGFVNGLEPGAPFEDKISFSGSVRTSGKVDIS